MIFCFLVIYNILICNIMDSNYIIQQLVAKLLSEILDVVSKQLLTGSPNCVSSSSLNEQCRKEVTEVVEEILQKITTENDEVSSQSDNFKTTKPTTLSNTKSTVLGVSQTGRIMDPICLQQNIFNSIAAENLVEYQWPPGQSGEYYMLQEQVSTFLNITSFKRKYPSIERRKLDPAEVNHLLSNHVISEVQVTLGLTALRSSDVLDLLVKEYPEKYAEFSNVMQEREKQKMRNKYKQYASSVNNSHSDKSQLNLKKAIRQAAAYNSHLNRQRREDFPVYYDLSTNVLQYPKNKKRKVDPELTRPSLYPCALLPGQFQEYYHKFTKDELMYLPLKTAIYGPPQPIITEADLSESESDSVPESDGSVSSAPRIVKSSSSNRTQDKIANSHQAATIATSSTNTKINGEPKKEKVIENGEIEDSSLESKDASKPVCGICHKDETCNKKGIPEDLIKCSQCDNHGHPSCLEMSSELVKVIQTYDWQCMECKTCTICSMPHREDRMMFCDRCDRGYHTFCVSLRAIPSGVWACSRCTFADPDFVKRKRKQLRASQTPTGVGRGRGRRRKYQRRGRPLITSPSDSLPVEPSELSSNDNSNSNFTNNSFEVFSKENATDEKETEKNCFDAKEETKKNCIDTKKETDISPMDTQENLETTSIAVHKETAEISADAEEKSEQIPNDDAKNILVNLKEESEKMDLDMKEKIQSPSSPKEKQQKIYSVTRSEHNEHPIVIIKSSSVNCSNKD